MKETLLLAGSLVSMALLYFSMIEAIGNRRKAAWFVGAVALLCALMLAGQCFGYDLSTPEKAQQNNEALFSASLELAAALAFLLGIVVLMFLVSSAERIRTAVLLIIVMLCLWVAAAERCFGAGLETCIDSTCRITANDGGLGSGVVFEHSQETVFVLTCAHVVKRSRTIRCEFWGNGEARKPVTGYVVSRVENDTVDAAVVAISDDQFNGVIPTVIPIAPRGTVIPAGATVMSVGCARGAWPTAWRGKILRSQYGDLRFWPVPADGRSGAAIFSADGSKIIGLIRARTMNGREGIACPLRAIYAALCPPRIFPGSPGPEYARPHPQGCCPDGLCPPDT